VTAAVPGLTESAAGKVAARAALLKNVVASAAPFSSTVESGSRFEPLKVRIKSGPPAVTELGLMPANEGGGLTTAKEAGDEVPPPGPGVLTVTVFVPGATMLAEASAALKAALLRKVVAREAPFQRTTEAGSKSEPVTLRAKAALPAAAELGLTPERDGAGLATVKEPEAVAPPPGEGL
jgi:hypothetical protein